MAFLLLISALETPKRGILNTKKKHFKCHKRLLSFMKWTPDLFQSWNLSKTGLVLTLSQLAGEDDIARNVLDILSASFEPKSSIREFPNSIFVSMSSRRRCVDIDASFKLWIDDVKLITLEVSSWKFKFQNKIYTGLLFPSQFYV